MNLEKIQDIFDRYYFNSPKAKRIVWEHSLSVRDLALDIAREVEGADLDFIEEAALLHDLGIVFTDAPDLGCFGALPYICHGVLGHSCLLLESLPMHGLVCERHTGVGLTQEMIEKGGLPLPRRDMVPVSLEEEILCYADKFFSKSSKEKKSLSSIRDGLVRHTGQEGWKIFLGWQERFGGVH